MYRATVTICFIIHLAVIVLCPVCVSVARAEPAVPVAASGEECLEQLRIGKSPWIECDGAFAADRSAQAELSKQTFDIVKGAKCAGTIRVQRTALTSALRNDGVLELHPLDVLCSITMNTDAKPDVIITLAPKVSFQANRVVDVSPRIVRIINLPQFVVAPLQSAAEAGIIRTQLAKGLNAFLEQALPK